jgi:hypothetical protein
MAIRTTRSTVTFSAPFQIRGHEQLQPAGTYSIETDEDVIESNDKTVYRRIATLLFVRNGNHLETWTIDPDDLNAALAKDSR